MATNHTENYQLNLWEPSDDFLRTEFNENFTKLDAAIKTCYQPGNFPWVKGTYTPNGQDVEVTLGFRPNLLILFTERAIAMMSGETLVKIYRHQDVNRTEISGIYGNLTDDGFVLRNSDSILTSATYAPVLHYIAFR